VKTKDRVGQVWGYCSDGPPQPQGYVYLILRRLLADSDYTRYEALDLTTNTICLTCEDETFSNWDDGLIHVKFFTDVDKAVWTRLA